MPQVRPSSLEKDGPIDYADAMPLTTDPIPVAGRPSFWQRSRPLLVGIAALVILALIVVAIRSLLKETSYSQIREALGHTSPHALALAVLFTAISFAGLIVYDVTGLIYVGKPLSYRTTILTAFCAYGVSNIAGFGPLTGGAIRYRFYTRAGLTPEEVARLIAFLAISYGLCLAWVGALGFLAAAGHIASLVKISPLWFELFAALVLGFFAYLYLIAGKDRLWTIRGYRFHLPSRRIIFQQSIATLVDVSAAAAVLWILLPAGTIGLPAFVAIYSVAVGLGILSHVPGGLGVFETIVIGVLAREIPIEQVVGAVILYRLIYFVLPLMVAGLIGAFMAARHHALELQFAPTVIAGIAFLLGAMLIFSSVVPADRLSLVLLAQYLPYSVVEIAHFGSGLTGLALIIVAGGLADRMRRAWRYATPLACVAMILSIIKGMAFIEAGMIAFLLAMLVIARSDFTRQDRLEEANITAWAMAALSIIALAATLFVFIYREQIGDELPWLTFEGLSEAPRAVRTIAGVTVAAFATIGWRLLRHPHEGRGK